MKDDSITVKRSELMHLLRIGKTLLQELEELRKEVSEMLDFNVELSNDLEHYRKLWKENDLKGPNQ